MFEYLKSVLISKNLFYKIFKNNKLLLLLFKYYILTKSKNLMYNHNYQNKFFYSKIFLFFIL